MCARVCSSACQWYAFVERVYECLRVFFLKVALAKSLLLRESRRELADADRISLDWAEAVVTLHNCIMEGGDPALVHMLEDELSDKRKAVCAPPLLPLPVALAVPPSCRSTTLMLWVARVPAACYFGFLVLMVLFCVCYVWRVRRANALSWPAGRIVCSLTRLSVFAFRKKTSGHCGPLGYGVHPTSAIHHAPRTMHHAPCTLLHAPVSVSAHV